MTAERNEIVPATAECNTALRRYPIVNVTTAPDDDPMFDPELRTIYLAMGAGALDVIRLAMVAGRKWSARSILDMASGYGRVLRFLRAEFPRARIAACDIDRCAVDFCVETFGAEPLYGVEHPVELDVQPFDLLWSGSLLTHLDKPAWDEFFEFFERAVMPRGLLVFSVHGRAIATRLRDPKFGDHYLGSADRNKAFAESCDGFAFAPYAAPTGYPEPGSYGLSLVKPSWLFDFLGQRQRWSVVTYMENRWGGHDVVGAVRL